MHRCWRISVWIPLLAVCCVQLGFPHAVIAQSGAADAAKPLPTATVTVSPLFYVVGGSAPQGVEAGQPYGMCQDFQLAVGGLPSGTIRIGVLESSLGGSGRLWKATTWQAALTAAQLLDFNPRTVQATLTVSGNLDGPSAGSLLTIGILAAVLGHELDPAMTMTGTINPDGIIGPVGGIPYKIEGAARAGKKVVLIPTNNRFEFDPRVRKPIDLIAHGQRLGVEVRLVNDVWSAYREFTGKELPRPRSAEAPVLPPAAIQHIARRVPSWMKLQQSARDKYLSSSKRGRNKYAKALLKESDVYRKQAEAFMQHGEFAAAYWDALWSATAAWAAHEVGRCEFAYHDGGLPAARRVVSEDDWLVKEVEKAGAALRFFRPSTFEQLAVYLVACNAFVEGLSYQRLAVTLRSKAPDDGAIAEQLIVAAAEQQTLAWIDMKLVFDLLVLADGYGGAPIPDDAPIDQLAEIYLRSAEAGQVVVEEIKLKAVAEQQNMTTKQAKDLLYMLDPQYAINDLTLETIYPRLSKYFGENKQLSYARLAVATTLHTRAAMLIAKYYSLGLQLDDEFNIVGITGEAALSDWLDDSEDQARRAIGALVDANIDHTTCTQIYSVGRIYEGRELEDRIESLEYFFQANVSAQVLKHLAQRNKP